MAQLLEVNPYIKAGTRNELQPSIIEMSDGAKALWIDFHNENETDLAGPENALPRELWNKAPEQAARIAGTIALVRGLRACPEEGNLPFIIPTISSEEMRGAIELTRYYRAEIVRLVEVGSVSQSVDTAQRLLDWFKARPEGDVVSLAEIYRTGPRRLRSATAVRRAIKILLDHGYVRQSSQPVKYMNYDMREAYYLRAKTGD